jgi:hypothetical protein
MERELVAQRAACEELGAEIARHLFHSMAGEFTLASGLRVRVTQIDEPQLVEGRWQFGFDTEIIGPSLIDHMEWTVCNTGQGSPVSTATTKDN